MTFLPTSVKVMYHLSQRMMKEQLDSPQAESKLEGSITSLLVTIIKTLSHQQKGEDFNESNLRKVELEWNLNIKMNSKEY